MKTLLYLASGPYCIHYADLPFDRMIFVDRSQKRGETYPGDSGRFRFISADALMAIDRLKREGVRIDCLVSVNEGLIQGGGTYPIFSGFLMGYLSPLLRDEFTLVCDLNYYVAQLRTPMGKLDWGFKKLKRLQREDDGYIDPSIFSYSQQRYPRDGYGHVFVMQRQRSVTELSLPDTDTKVKIVHGSIWDDEKQLDLIGLNLLSRQPLMGGARGEIRSVDDFFRAKPKVMDINGQSFNEILTHCQERGHKRLGLTPWMGGNYQGVLDALRGMRDMPFESITFYHLNRNDFSMLRGR
jgi:hypothetical protein